MKNVLALTLISCLIFVSCKKDRVCSCTTTTTGLTTIRTEISLAETDTSVTTPLSTTSTNDITFFKVTKRAAKNNCFNKSENVNESSQNGIPGIINITTTNTGKRNFDCKLE